MPYDQLDALRVQVRRGLDRFCQGKFYMEYGLAETDRLLPDKFDVDDLEASGLMDKKSNFQKFLKAVATENVKDSKESASDTGSATGGKGRKKRIKEKLEILQAFSGDWATFIQKNMRKKTSKVNTPEPSGYQDPHSGDGHAKNDGTPNGSEKKKGAKRGPRGPYKKRKMKPSSGTPEPVIPSPKKRQKMDATAARKEFEREKEGVMAQVPADNKKLFLQVGFAKWGKGYLPAMAVSPYDVPPGDIRDQWMKMYQNVVEKNRINLMGHLVWWISPDEEEEDSSYSVVPNNGFLSYEEGKKKGYHELPKNMKKLLEKGKPFNAKQEEIAGSLTLLNELALQEPEDREHPRSNFSEEEFWGLDDDAVDLDEEEEEEEEEDELVDEKEILAPTKEKLKGKKKKNKKRKKEEGDEEILYDDAEDLEEAPVKKKKKKDKTKLEKGKKKKKKKTLADDSIELQDALDAEDPELDDDADDMPMREKVLDEDEDDEDMDLDDEPRRKTDEEFLEDASVASADSALVDSDFDDGVVADDDDEQLRGVEPETQSTKKLKKLQKKSKKGKDKAVKEEAVDGGDGKKVKKKKKIKEEDTSKGHKKRSKAAEQRDLERCEEEYLPILENLKIAREKKNAEMIQKVLETLLPVAEKFTASFFSEYDIPRLMKNCKSTLEEIGGDTSVYRRLWNKMKGSYTLKVTQLPEGFKAKKRKSIKPVKQESSARASDDEPATKILVKEEPTSIQSTPAASESVPMTDGVPSKTPLKDIKRRASADIDLVTKTSDKSAVKSKPKKFSIMDIMAKKKDSKQNSIGGAPDRMSSSSAVGTSSKKTVPSWVTAPLPIFDSFVGCEQREDRMFALEFLLQAAAHFPGGKGANEESIARSLELAIFEWSKSKGSFGDTYWEKVHAIVAALTGKREVGTLINSILEGSFPSAKSVVSLSFDNLVNSFEGLPISLSGE